MKDVIIVELENHLSATNCDFKQISVGWHTRQRDCLCSKNRLWHDRHHKGADIEPKIKCVGNAAMEGIGRRGTLGQRLEATPNLDLVGVVGQSGRETEDDLVLVGQVVDG